MAVEALVSSLAQQWNERFGPEELHSANAAFDYLKGYFDVALEKPANYVGMAIDSARRKESECKSAGKNVLSAILYERMVKDDTGLGIPTEMLIMNVQTDGVYKSRWVVSREKGVEAYNLRSDEIPIEGWQDSTTQEEHENVFKLVEMTKKRPIANHHHTGTKIPLFNWFESLLETRTVK